MILIGRKLNLNARSKKRDQLTGQSENHSMCSCQGTVSRESDTNKFTISGGNDEGVPPVPIPNTEVKPFSAESTWLDTAREDRSLPDSIFLSSSMAEHSAVNRVVVGSSPTWGAENQADALFSFFMQR